jgi:peroxiredoxin
MRKLWILAAVGALVLVLAIVALRRESAGGRAPDAPIAENAPALPDPPACPVDAKKANLDFTLEDIDGRPVRLSDYRGKVLLLDFWATWCGPCKVEIPGFVDLYSRYKSKGFEIVGVVVLDEFAKARPFAQQFKMNYTIVDGNDRQDLEDAFGPMPGLPTSFMIARDGRICSTHIGLPSRPPSDRPVGDVVRDIFEAEIKALL